MQICPRAWGHKDGRKEGWPKDNLNTNPGKENWARATNKVSRQEEADATRRKERAPHSAVSKTQGHKAEKQSNAELKTNVLYKPMAKLKAEAN